MGSYVDLTGETINLISEKDNIRIRKVYETKIGGCVLDTTDFPDEVIESGHVVIKNDTTGIFKPMPIVENSTSGEYEYGTLPSGYSYFGFVIASVLTKKPMVGVVTRGSINPAAVKYSLTTILAAVKAALPHITFVED